MNKNTTFASSNPVPTSAKKSHRGIDRRRLAQLKRTMEGALGRVQRYEKELSSCSDTIKRGYEWRYDRDGNKKMRISLTPSQVNGVRLKKVDIEEMLAIAKREYFNANRDYSRAVKTNTSIGRSTVKLLRTEYQTLRREGALLKQTFYILKEHGMNGGATQVEHLKELATKSNYSIFQKSFDACFQQFDEKAFSRISAVPSVKMSIVQSVMSEFAKGVNKEQEIQAEVVS